MVLQVTSNCNWAFETIKFHAFWWIKSNLFCFVSLQIRTAEVIGMPLSLPLKSTLDVFWLRQTVKTDKSRRRRKRESERKKELTKLQIAQGRSINLWKSGLTIYFFWHLQYSKYRCYCVFQKQANSEAIFNSEFAILLVSTRNWNLWARLKACQKNLIVYWKLDHFNYNLPNRNCLLLCCHKSIKDQST